MITALSREVLYKRMMDMKIHILVYSLELIPPRRLSHLVVHFSACSISLYSEISEFLVTWACTKYILVLGGEDCKFRLWNIKSGKLIFEDKFGDAVPSTICWRRAGGSNYCSLLFLSYSCASSAIYIFFYWTPPRISKRAGWIPGLRRS